MRKLIAATLILICLAFASAAQSPAVTEGSPSELRGLTRVYILVTLDNPEQVPEVRENIATTIRKAKTPLSITSDINNAEVILSYDGRIESLGYLTNTSGTIDPPLYPGGPITTTSTSTTRERIKIYARGTVAIPTADNGFRVLSRFQDSKTTVLERRPSTNLARVFIKLWKDAQK